MFDSIPGWLQLPVMLIVGGFFIWYVVFKDDEDDDEPKKRPKKKSKQRKQQKPRKSNKKSGKSKGKKKGITIRIDPD